MPKTKVVNNEDTNQANTSPERFNIEFPALSEYVSVIRLTLSGIAARLEFPVDIIDDIKVAVSEACTNVIQHAYNDQPGKVYLTCDVFEDKLEITVKDNGTGFQKDKVKSAEQRYEEELDESLGLGLGLTFIQTLMDESDISSEVGSGTTIKMVKKKPRTSNN